MRSFLIDNVLPFWLKNGVDRECGGMITKLDRSGVPYGYEKNVWFEGRSMYTYCLAYNELNPDPEYLVLAENMYGFLKKCELDSTGRLPFFVSRDGSCLVKNSQYYSETFAAIGCTEYYLATGREELRSSAERYFDIAYSMYRAELSPPPDDHLYAPKTKALGPSMIMLSTAQVLRKLDFDKYHKIAGKCAEEIWVHFKDGKGLLENVAFDGSFVDTPSGREINPGHSLEAGWFLLSEAVYRSDEEMKTRAKKIIDISMKLGYRDGGIIAFCDSDGHPHEALEWDMKIWWPQCEAMIANRLAYNIFGEEKYLRDFEALRDYCFSRYPDGESGEWFGYLHYDGTVANSLKGNMSKGPFHLPRMLYIVDKLERGENIW